MKSFLEFLDEDTFQAPVATNAIGNGSAIQNFDPLLKKSKKKTLVLKRQKPTE